MPKPILLANGARMTNGQIIGGDPMNSSMHRVQVGRDGKLEKRIVEAAPSWGAKRQTKPSHEFLHGAPPLDDEGEMPIKSYEKPIPLHPSVTERQRAEVHPIANSANVILSEAATLGPKPRE